MPGENSGEFLCGLIDVVFTDVKNHVIFKFEWLSVVDENLRSKKIEGNELIFDMEKDPIGIDSIDGSIIFKDPERGLSIIFGPETKLDQILKFQNF